MFVPLSSGEEHFLRQEESQRRRKQRLIEVRRQEKRIAQEQAQWYKAQLKQTHNRKRAARMQVAEVEKSVVLSSLHAKYNASLAAIGDAHTLATELNSSLQARAKRQLEVLAHNDGVEDQRFSSAVEDALEDVRRRTARERIARENMAKIHEIASRQRAHAEKVQRHKLERDERERQHRDAMARAVEARREHTTVSPTSVAPVQVHESMLHHSRLHAMTHTTSSSVTRNRIVRHNVHHAAAMDAWNEGRRKRHEVDQATHAKFMAAEAQTADARDRGAVAERQMVDDLDAKTTLQWLQDADRVYTQQTAARQRDLRYVMHRSARERQTLERATEAAFEATFSRSGFEGEAAPSPPSQPSTRVWNVNQDGQMEDVDEEAADGQAPRRRLLDVMPAAPPTAAPHRNRTTTEPEHVPNRRRRRPPPEVSSAVYYPQMDDHISSTSVLRADKAGRRAWPLVMPSPRQPSPASNGDDTGTVGVEDYERPSALGKTVHGPAVDTIQDNDAVASPKQSMTLTTDPAEIGTNGRLYEGEPTSAESPHGSVWSSSSSSTSLDYDDDGDTPIPPLPPVEATIAGRLSPALSPPVEFTTEQHPIISSVQPNESLQPAAALSPRHAPSLSSLSPSSNHSISSSSSRRGALTKDLSCVRSSSSSSSLSEPAIATQMNDAASSLDPSTLEGIEGPSTLTTSHDMTTTFTAASGDEPPTSPSVSTRMLVSSGVISSQQSSPPHDDATSVALQHLSGSPTRVVVVVPPTSSPPSSGVDKGTQVVHPADITVPERSLPPPALVCRTDKEAKWDAADVRLSITFDTAAPPPLRDDFCHTSNGHTSHLRRGSPSWHGDHEFHAAASSSDDDDNADDDTDLPCFDLNSSTYSSEGYAWDPHAPASPLQPPRHQSESAPTLTFPPAFHPTVRTLRRMSSLSNSSSSSSLSSSSSSTVFSATAARLPQSSSALQRDRQRLQDLLGSSSSSSSSSAYSTKEQHDKEQHDAMQYAVGRMRQSVHDLSNMSTSLVPTTSSSRRDVANEEEEDMEVVPITREEKNDPSTVRGHQRERNSDDNPPDSMMLAWKSATTAPLINMDLSMASSVAPSSPMSSSSSLSSWSKKTSEPLASQHSFFHDDDDDHPSHDIMAGKASAADAPLVLQWLQHAPSLSSDENDRYDGRAGRPYPPVFGDDDMPVGADDLHRRHATETSSGAHDQLHHLDDVHTSHHGVATTRDIHHLNFEDDDDDGWLEGKRSLHTSQMSSSSSSSSVADLARAAIVDGRRLSHIENHIAVPMSAQVVLTQVRPRSPLDAGRWLHDPLQPAMHKTTEELDDMATSSLVDHPSTATTMSATAHVHTQPGSNRNIVAPNSEQSLPSPGPWPPRAMHHQPTGFLPAESPAPLERRPPLDAKSTECTGDDGGFYSPARDMQTAVQVMVEDDAQSLLSIQSMQSSSHGRSSSSSSMSLDDTSTLVRQSLGADASSSPSVRSPSTNPAMSLNHPPLSSPARPPPRVTEPHDPFPNSAPSSSASSGGHVNVAEDVVLVALGSTSLPLPSSSLLSHRGNEGALSTIIPQPPQQATTTTHDVSAIYGSAWKVQFGAARTHNPPKDAKDIIQRGVMLTTIHSSSSPAVDASSIGATAMQSVRMSDIHAALPPASAPLARLQPSPHSPPTAASIHPTTHDATRRAPSTSTKEEACSSRVIVYPPLYSSTSEDFVPPPPSFNRHSMRPPSPPLPSSPSYEPDDSASYEEEDAVQRMPATLLQSTGLGGSSRRPMGLYERGDTGDDSTCEPYWSMSYRGDGRGMPELLPPMPFPFPMDMSVPPPPPPLEPSSFVYVGPNTNNDDQEDDMSSSPEPVSIADHLRLRNPALYHRMSQRKMPRPTPSRGGTTPDEQRGMHTCSRLHVHSLCVA
ncbi:hypothetical protein, variant [Aphanomyces astaci]|uniref:Uncharacterized protein n=1 Tax=Aphanomyces astaci TaxID=112090 RepID=W4FW68_APHAT|nr:hypothetical protein, variant [Aphanomyces astaci]ETV70908.1 hypothetical protein, variant [Aphanomyces astaci]|eukprot:XP_009839571.1 hypothetical protein, variant [Aphanomyces astaci]